LSNFKSGKNTMIREFEKLKDQEIELLLKAPLLVCILIAGADGTIDKKEIKEAISIAEKKNKKKGVLGPYFAELAQDFEDKLKILIQSYPYESTQRNPLIISELAALNQLWAKVGPSFAAELYITLKDIAAGIASSSGGLLGLRSSIDAEEAKLIQLNMIQNPAQ
jgi:hypothetical protein